MVWLLLGIVIWGSLMFLVTPLLRKTPAGQEYSHEIRAYKGEIERLDAEIKGGGAPELESRKIDLQRQLLELTQKPSPDTKGPSYLVINSLFAFFVFGGIGLYTQFGSPELTKDDALETSAAPQGQARSQAAAGQDREASLETLVSQLKSKLEGERKDDANGWMLYARTLMNLRQYEDAFSAYEQALILTDNNPEIAEEFSRARAFSVQGSMPATRPSTQPQAQRGPSAEDIEAAASMSENDRNAMVQNMVASLAARLRETPDNPEGWARLLRARKVLGQTVEAEADIALLNKTYASDPGKAAQILAQAGWEK